MKRIEVMKVVGAREGLIVCNLGFPSRELFSLSDKPSHFYMLGSMGMASSIGLGLALAQKKRVYVIDGDGSLLMNMGSLATIAHHAPHNYCLIVIDNRCYSSTGNQPTSTSGKTDLAGIARAAGISPVKVLDNLKDLEDCLDLHHNTSLMVVVKTDSSNPETRHIPLLPRSIAKRLMGEVRRSEK
jgi:sulfopyruvate decarboxylase subunit beta